MTVIGIVKLLMKLLSKIMKIKRRRYYHGSYLLPYSQECIEKRGRVCNFGMLLLNLVHMEIKPVSFKCVLCFLSFFIFHQRDICILQKYGYLKQHGKVVPIILENCKEKLRLFFIIKTNICRLKFNYPNQEMSQSCVDLVHNNIIMDQSH